MAQNPEFNDLANAVVVEQTQLQIESRPEWIEPTVEYLKKKAVLCGACSDSRSDRLMLALHEGITNAVVHGNLEVSSELKEQSDDAFIKLLASRAADPKYHRRNIDISVHYNGRRCQWAITDEGPGFDFQAVMDRTEIDDPEVLLSSGRGILMMRSFMDDIHYELNGRRLVLTLAQESGTERRRQDRAMAHTSLHVAPIKEDGTVDWNAAYEAIARNLSADGIGIIQRKLANTGRVLIGFYSDDKPVYLPAEIRHWRSVGDDMVELGCCFRPDGVAAIDVPVQPAAAAARTIDRLLLKAEAGSPHENLRTDKRLPFAERIEIVPSKVDSQPLIGYSRDLSRGGIAFLTTEPLSGDVTLEFSQAGDEPPVKMRTEIVRCVQVQEGFYDIGGRFIGMESEVETSD